MPGGTGTREAARCRTPPGPWAGFACHSLRRSAWAGLCRWRASVRCRHLGEGVSRVIARPCVGSRGGYARTDRRRDFSLRPTAPTVLDAVSAQGLEVVGIGKISDLFAGRGVTRSIHTRDDLDGMAQTGAAMTATARGIIFTNLVDLDSKFGHRNDPAGYARDLEAIDAALPQVMGRVRADDLVVITADHGNDPTTGSTDHAREYVPVLFGGPAVRGGVDLGVRSTFADVGATVADALAIPWEGPGTSVLPMITK